MHVNLSQETPSYVIMSSFTHPGTYFCGILLRNGDIVIQENTFENIASKLYTGRFFQILVRQLVDANWRINVSAD